MKPIQETFEQAKQLMETDPEGAHKILQTCEAHAEDNEDYERLCDILTFRGRSIRISGDIYDALFILNKAYRIINNYLRSDNKRLGLIYREYTAIYADGLGDHDTAQDYAFRCIQLDIPDLNGIFYNNLGSNFLSKNELGNAEKYLEKGKKISEAESNYFVLCYIYENLGTLYYKKGNYELSLENYYKGLEYFEKLDKDRQKKREANLIKAIMLLEMTPPLLKLNREEEAQRNLDQVETVLENVPLAGIQSMYYLFKGDLHLAKNECSVYEHIFGIAEQFCLDNSLYLDLEKWYKQMTDIYTDKNDFENALKYSQLTYLNSERMRQKTKKIIMSNVLESKEVEILELENRNREIQLQKEELEQFAYIVTHDLKTPLSNIANYMGLIRKKNPELNNEENKPLVDVVIKSSQDLGTMLSDLMQYITLDNRAEDFYECDIPPIIEKINLNLQNKIKDASATINYKGIEKINLRSFHLELLLENLIKNGIKFRRNGVNPIVNIEITEEVDSFTCMVADNGIGIDDDHKPLVFQIFKRLNKGKYAGTGMGLSICKKIVDTYNGLIDIKDNEGDGSVFVITFPKLS